MNRRTSVGPCRRRPRARGSDRRHRPSRPGLDVVGVFYNATLANDAHARGPSVLQKNDNEQCNQYEECTTKQNGGFGLDQYVDAGKPVFQTEHKLETSQFCDADNANDCNGVRYAFNPNDKVVETCR